MTYNVILQCYPKYAETYSYVKVPPQELSGAMVKALKYRLNND